MTNSDAKSANNAEKANQPDVSSLVEAEKKFLHDVSSPLSIVVFHLEAASLDPMASDVPMRLEKAFRQVKLIIEKLEERRNHLKAF